jgi:hypothetical protein
LRYLQEIGLRTVVSHELLVSGTVEQTNHVLTKTIVALVTIDTIHCEVGVASMWGKRSADSPPLSIADACIWRSGMYRLPWSWVYAASDPEIFSRLLDLASLKERHIVAQVATQGREHVRSHLTSWTEVSPRPPLTAVELYFERLAHTQQHGAPNYTCI